MQRLVIEALEELPPACVISRLSDLAFLCSADAQQLYYVNPRAAEYLGWTQAEIQSLVPWWQKLLCNHSHRDFAHLWELAKSGGVSSDLLPIELGCVGLGGTTLDIQIHSVFPTPHATLLLGSKAVTSELAEEVLRQTQARFRSIVDSLSVNLVLKDVQGRRVYANQAYLTLRNLSLGDIIGKRDEDLFPEDIAEKFSRDDQYVLQTAEVLQKSEENVASDGSRTWTEIVKGPIWDADGNVSGVQILFWDATERKATEQELERERSLLHALLDNVPDSIYFKDLDSRFVRISRGMARKFNLASTDVAIGRTDADVFTSEHAAQAREDELRIIQTGEPMVGMVERETWPDRTDTWCSTTKLPLKDSDGKIVGTFGISRDVTELIQVEQQLREARDQADKASQAKSEFLANMSHEIRTPMNGIIGMAELLGHTQLNDAQRSFLDMIAQSAQSLLRIINDILDFSKIEAGKLEIETVPFDLRKCISHAAKGLAVRAASKSVELILEIAADVPDCLVGDADRLRQILINLVGNAIKFTDQGTITIRVAVANGPPTETEYTLHFSVTDTGIGIAKNKQEAIFEAFSQADVSTTRQYGGTGLGLSISSQLVQMMGGRIWLNSQLGVGSAFHFTCRMPSGEEAQPPEDTVDENALRAMPVLLVDDSQASRNILANALSMRGLLVYQAATASEAKRLLDESLDAKVPSAESSPPQSPIALIVDQVMPDCDGLELLEQLAAMASARRPIKILLTSASQAGIGNQSSPADDVILLQKPALHSEICQAIDRALAPVPVAQSPRAEADLKESVVPLNTLVVEDGHVNRAVLVGLLEREGHRVAVAEDGSDAVTAWQTNDFDAIFMDLQMPIMDGVEATTVIRKAEAEDPKRRRIPIIATTAAAMQSDQNRCLEAGMDDYLSKPINLNLLRELLGRLAEYRDQTDTGLPFPIRQAASPHAPATNLGTSPANSLNFDAPVKKLKYTAEQQLKLVETLKRETAQRLDELTLAIETEDAKLLIRASHSLKSAAGLFQAEQVMDSAAVVETSARAGDLATAIKHFPQLRDAASAMLREIEAWLGARG
ncbi:MAG: PAS domain-containing protein [Planctomycetales bacterium]|nr:PAS domain-containing protein [Planctomycetales bacterium]